MTIEKIVKEWLSANGYDGLYSDECGCEIANFMPCGEHNNCSAGYKVPCPGPEGCWADGDCLWHISSIRPKEVGMTK